MRETIAALEAEFWRYKALGDSALAQLDDDLVSRVPAGESNSVAVIVWHLAGNFESRFTDFLTSDGEKPWRDRDGEFEGTQCDARGRDRALASGLGGDAAGACRAA